MYMYFGVKVGFSELAAHLKQCSPVHNEHNEYVLKFVVVAFDQKI